MNSATLKQTKINYFLQNEFKTPENTNKKHSNLSLCGKSAGSFKINQKSFEKSQIESNVSAFSSQKFNKETKKILNEFFN